MTANKLTKGIDENFAKSFKQSELSALYESHRDELYIGICNNYLHIFFNCNSIAKIKYKQENIYCETAVNLLRNTNIRNPKNITSFQIVKNYKQIKDNIGKMQTPEKKAQSKLVLLNNVNIKSKWFCIDIEWAKSGFSGRFDIVAISKETPHSIALIELKYGRHAIGGKCGIRRHIEDFHKFQGNNYFEKYMRQDIIGIIKSYQMLGLDLPDELQYLTADDIVKYNFYVVTLDNNGETPQHSTPKQTMAAYLFNDLRWGCKELAAPPSVEEQFGDVTKKNNKFQVTFLFSEQTLDNLNIEDVIDGNYYDKKIPR
jgi:hypothetical protein